MTNIEQLISRDLEISFNQVSSTVKLLKDDNSIPFISRYRKEATGTLDESQIRDIDNRLKYYTTLQERKSQIIRSLETQEVSSPELLKRISDCWDAKQLEDLYLPFKPKRRTKASIAKEKGLQPLADTILDFPRDANLEALAQQYVNEKVENVDQAIQGACHIIAESISELPSVRDSMRRAFRSTAIFSSTCVKGKEIEGRHYENYYDFCSPARRVSAHQLLAILRAEREGFLKANLRIETEKACRQIYIIIARQYPHAHTIIKDVIEDSYKRLIEPSIENEVIQELKEQADDLSIDTFMTNLEHLLLAAPLGEKALIAIDPGYRTGCKLVCLDETGKLVHDTVIYPTAPHYDVDGAQKKILSLVEQFSVSDIAVGNGTAGRDTEKFLKRIPFPQSVNIHTVDESGASIYSASDIGRSEFPDKDITVRGAVSIGRRLQDPLAELVKIDPKSIGVGQYQHDVDQQKLRSALDSTVVSCVNRVGVNVNTASIQLLTHISGLGPALAKNITKYRGEHGSFNSRSELLKVPKLGPKTFEQAAGFLRIPHADNPLDNSAVHPERYALVQQIARDYGYDLNSLIGNQDVINKIDIKRYVSSEVGLPTLIDILKELEKPGLDPRGIAQQYDFDESLQDIEDLKVDMELNGVISNVTQFGAFVNIGIHENGLIHVSQLSTRRITNPSKVVKVGQRVRVRIIAIDLERKRISLSMKNVEQKL